jgi:hypothetical protein
MAHVAVAVIINGMPDVWMNKSGRYNIDARELTTDFHECDGAGRMIRFETYVFGQSTHRGALRPGALARLKSRSND